MHRNYFQQVRAIDELNSPPFSLWLSIGVHSGLIQTKSGIVSKTQVLPFILMWLICLLWNRPQKKQQPHRKLKQISEDRILTSRWLADQTAHSWTASLQGTKKVLFAWWTVTPTLPRKPGKHRSACFGTRATLCKCLHLSSSSVSPQRLAESPDQEQPKRKINGCLFLPSDTHWSFFCIEIRTWCPSARVIAPWYISPKFLQVSHSLFSHHPQCTFPFQGWVFYGTDRTASILSNIKTCQAGPIINK